MSGRMRLDLIVRRYPRRGAIKATVIEPGLISATWDADQQVDRWTWRLSRGGHVVSSSGSQRYSRRIDCVRGAEAGAGIYGIPQALTALRNDWSAHLAYAFRWTNGKGHAIETDVRILDERAAPTRLRPHANPNPKKRDIAPPSVLYPSAGDVQ